MDEARLSSLIGDVYDAALDPDLWVGTLEKTCDFVVGIAATLQSHDISERTANFYFTWNDNPDYTKSYVEKYARINPAIVSAAMHLLTACAKPCRRKSPGQENAATLIRRSRQRYEN